MILGTEYLVATWGARRTSETNDILVKFDEGSYCSCFGYRGSLLPATLISCQQQHDREGGGLSLLRSNSIVTSDLGPMSLDLGIVNCASHMLVEDGEGMDGQMEGGIGVGNGCR